MPTGPQIRQVGRLNGVAEGEEPALVPSAYRPRGAVPLA